MRSVLSALPSLLLAACSGSPPSDDTAVATCTNGNAHAMADAAVLADGAPGEGETCRDGSADWWAFSVATPGWYTLAATAEDSDAQRVLFTVVDPAGQPWTVSQYQPGTQAFYLASAGTWYVEVAAPGVDAPLAYTVAPATVDGDTSAEDAVVPLTVTADSGLRFAVPLEDTDDADTVSITAPSHTWLTVRTDPEYQRARMSDVALTFLDVDGAPLTRTLTADLTYVPVGDEPVQLSVAASGAAGWTGLELRVGEAWVGEAEPNESAEQATEFADSAYLGVLSDEADQDWYHTVVTDDSFVGVYCYDTLALLEDVGIEVWDSTGTIASDTTVYESDATPGQDIWVRIHGATTGPGAWYSCTMTTVRPPTWDGE